MIPPALLLLAIGEGFKFVNLLIEAEPLELRQAKAKMWFWLWWPMFKQLLKMYGITPEQIKQIEDLAGK